VLPPFLFPFRVKPSESQWLIFPPPLQSHERKILAPLSFFFPFFLPFAMKIPTLSPPPSPTSACLEFWGFGVFFFFFSSPAFHVLTVGYKDLVPPPPFPEPLWTLGTYVLLYFPFFFLFFPLDWMPLFQQCLGATGTSPSTKTCQGEPPPLLPTSFQQGRSPSGLLRMCTPGESGMKNLFSLQVDRNPLHLSP